MHELSGIIDARQVTQCGHPGPGDGALDTPQSLEGLDHGSQAPSVHLLVECEFETPQTFRLFRDGLDVLLQDHRLRGGGTHHLAEPSQVGRAPVGPPWRAESGPQHEGFEPYRGRLPIPQGLFPRPTQVADRCIVDGRHRHRGEVPGAHEPGQWQGITPVGCDAVTGLLGHASDCAGYVSSRSFPSLNLRRQYGVYARHDQTAR